LRTSLDSGLRARAEGIQASIKATPSDVGPLAEATRLQGESLAQLYGPSGELLASSSGAGSTAIIGPADAARARGDDVSESITLRDANEPNKAGEHTRLLISPVNMPGGTGVLVLGTPLESA